MDENFVIIALSPFYVLAVSAAAFVTAHLIRSFNESATQTQLTETIPK